MGVAGMAGIQMDVSGVTLDLNGFDVVGVAGSTDGFQFVNLTGIQTNTEIKNAGAKLG